MDRDDAMLKEEEGRVNTRQLDMASLESPLIADEDRESEGDRDGNEVEEMDEQIGLRVMRKVSFRIKPMLFGIAFLISLSQQNLTYSAEGMINDLHIDSKLYGAAISAYFLPSALLQLPMSLLYKRLSIRTYVLILLSLRGAASASMCLVQNIYTLFIVRVIMGAFSAGMNPVRIAEKSLLDYIVCYRYCQ